jgi:hypothetical protein
MFVELREKKLETSGVLREMPGNCETSLSPNLRLSAMP